MYWWTVEVVIHRYGVKVIIDQWGVKLGNNWVDANALAGHNNADSAAIPVDPEEAGIFFRATVAVGPADCKEADSSLGGIMTAANKLVNKDGQIDANI